MAIFTELTDEQRLELSHDLSAMWNNFQARPEVMWLRTSFGLVRFSKAGVHVEVGESLGHQVRAITDEESAAMFREFPDLEKVVLG